MSFIAVQVSEISVTFSHFFIPDAWKFELLDIVAEKTNIEPAVAVTELTGKIISIVSLMVTAEAVILETESTFAPDVLVRKAFRSRVDIPETKALAFPRYIALALTEESDAILADASFIPPTSDEKGASDNA